MIYLIPLLCGIGGGAISIICGFGLGIFTMMFLPHFVESTVACAAVVSITSLFQSAWVCYYYRKKVQWKDIVFTAIGYFILSTVGVLCSKHIPTQTLKLALGILMVFLAIYFVFISSRLKVKPTPVNGLIAGGLGGIMSSLFGVGGPPASVYFSSSYENKEVYLATIQTYFMLTNIYVTSVRAINGIITKEVLIISFLCIVGMAIGTFLGKKVFDKINANVMRKAIYALMAVSGITLMVGALK